MVAFSTGDRAMDKTRQLVPEWLHRAAQNYPTRVALEFERDVWTFAALDSEVTALARRLASAGVHEGARVAVLAPNSPEFVIAVHALPRLGAILVPLNTRLTEAELVWQLRDVHATMLLVTDATRAMGHQIVAALHDITALRLDLSLRAPTSAEDAGGRIPSVWELPEGTLEMRTEVVLDAVQAIMYTSGTTGSPKGALLTFGMQWWSATASALNLGLSPDDCWLVCLPLYHVGGLTTLMKSSIYGMRIVLHERFDPVAVNRAIEQQHITMLSVVAVMVQRMLDTLPYDSTYPACLRCVLLGGGPAPRPLLEACAARGIPVIQTYGLTESCSQAVTLAPVDALRKLGAAGRPLLPVQLCIEKDGKVVGPAVAGEICLRGPTISPGYADRPSESARAFRNGWFATGDIGYLDDEGYLYVLDRRTDLIVSGGENVYPAEIESVLLAHPAVADAGVCGVADERWGEVPIGFVRLYDGLQVSEGELLRFASERVARYKVPRGIRIVEALPRNGAGKLLRRRLPALLHEPSDEQTPA